jgi:hypothetical protein
MSRRRAQGDDGVILVMAALTLVGLLGFAALVVDLGNVYQVRRQAQNTADAAALAGAQDLPQGASVVATVKDYAQQNLGIAPESWVGCMDESPLAVLPDAANSNQCISIDNGYKRVRVQLPTRAVPTYFGSLFGHASINTSAAATAEAVLVNADRIIPATITVAQGTGNLCIENSGNDQACAARNTGNFGSVSSPRINLYTVSSHQDALRINWALSLDHDIDVSTGYPQVCDGDPATPCVTSNMTSPYTADHLRVETGNNVPDLTDGIIGEFTMNTPDEGVTTFCGRLARPDTTRDNILDPRPGGSCTPGGPTIAVAGHTINGRHLYAWLTPEAKRVFYPEVWATNTTVGPALTDPIYANGDGRLACFLRQYRYSQATGIETVPNCVGVSSWSGLYQSGTDTALWPIFVKGITADPRFGVIPVVQYWPSGNSQAAPVTGFWGSFIYRTYASNTQLKGLDGWVYDPALIQTDSGHPGIQFGFQLSPHIRLIE